MDVFFTPHLSLTFVEQNSSSNTHTNGVNKQANREGESVSTHLISIHFGTFSLHQRERESENAFALFENFISTTEQ